MLVPDYYDDYGCDDDSEAAPAVSTEAAPAVSNEEEFTIDHYHVHLYCKICKEHHNANIRGPIPENREAPCYECWSAYYAPVLAVEPEKKEPKKPAPRAVSTPEWDSDFDADLLEAYGFYGFGL